MMTRVLRRRTSLAFILAASLIALAAATSTAAMASTGGGPVWGAPTTSTGSAEGLFVAAACPDSSVCLAAGSTSATSNGVPEVAAESGGSWGLPAFAAVLGVPSENARFNSISCMSASACVGVGVNSATAPAAYTPFVDSLNVSGTTAISGLASTPSLSSLPGANANEEASLDSVSCTANGCTAVGSYETNGNVQEPFEANFANGSWSVAAVSAPAAGTHGANLAAVSCPSSGACEAVGEYLDGSNDEHGWALQLVGGATPQILPAPADAISHTGTIAAVPALISGTGGQMMTGVSCPTAAACTAVGQYSVSGGTSSMAVGIDNGTPGTPITLQPQNPSPLTAVTAVWCADGGNCAIIGDAEVASVYLQPVTAYESSGAWSSLTPPPGSAPNPGVSFMAAIGLGCVSVESCMSSGTQLSTSGYAPLADFSAPPLSVTTSSLPAATAGQPYSATVQSSGGAGPGTWTVSGSLPAGLSLNASTGVISGTPTTPGAASFSVQLASAGPPAQTASVNLSITVAAAPAVPVAPTLSAGAAKVTRNGVTLPIGCVGSGTCSGTAVLTAVEHLSGKRPTAVTAHAKRRKLEITLARGGYSLTAGQVGTVTLKLSAKARALLKQLHTIKGTLILTPTGATAPTVIRAVTFKSPAKKKK